MINRSFLAALALVTACLAGWTCFGSPSGGPLDPEANTDGFSPAAEIDEINEARRRDLIARQLDLNLQYELVWLRLRTAVSRSVRTLVAGRAG